MINNLVTIFLHCNTPEKIKVLEDNIDNLKSNGLDILLHSHIPVSKEIQSKVDYFIYDKSNPILHWPRRGMVFWKNVPYEDKKLHLMNILPDYGWTVFNQLSAAGYLGLSLDYSHYSFINYDIILTQKIIESLLNPKELLCTKVLDNTDEKGYRFPSFMLNILSKENLAKFLPLISKKQYMNGPDYPKPSKFRDAEHYLEHLLSVFNYETFPDLIGDQISYGEPNPFKLNKEENFDLFYQTVLNSATPPMVLLYNMKSDFKININGEEFLAKAPLFLHKIPTIEQFGYWLNDSYIDLTSIFKTKRQTSIDIHD